MEVGKVLAVVALVVCVIGAFMPVVGLYVGWIALLFAAVAALFGERSLVIATVVVSALVFVLLTPSLWLTQGATMLANAGDAYGGGQEFLNPFLIMTLAALAAPVAALLLRSSGKLALGSPRAGEPQ